jgi:hypothetical protein
MECYDRYDRSRGAAAAMTLNYDGFYAGSCWAYFGVENTDLFQSADGPMARALQQAAQYMVQEVYLHNVATDRRLYRPGEPMKVSVVVDNRGGRANKANVRFCVRGDDRRVVAERSQQVVVRPAENVSVEVTFETPGDGPDLCQIEALLEIDGRSVDRMETGIVIEDAGILTSGPQLRFADNYFALNGRPTFLFGTDTYARTYQSAAENPLTWHAELAAARDFGMNLYENLQYSRPGHAMTDDDWRSFRAMSQLTQRLKLVFMPGMLIGHNVAIGDEALREQSALCRRYAKRLGATPGLLYYINGDYQMRLEEQPEDVLALWNMWLAERYETTERLRAAWGEDTVEGQLGEIDFPPPNSGRWDDVAAIDRLRFQTWLTERWNEAHVAAVREQDRAHPITSEYYSWPIGGLDLPLTIAGQDVSNIGYFDQPVSDIDNLPTRIRFNDLRARGKGVSLGEYGVKTHPAWREENGGRGYHIARTEEEQKQLFLAVAHYALGLGACKVQNWCLRDAQARVFPWGIFYPNQLVPKDVASVHRNLSIVWRHFRPIDILAPVTVCLANQLRLGNVESIGPTVAYRAFSDLLALHFPFNTIDDHHLDALPESTQVLIYPSPFAVSDDTFERLAHWVNQGGTLLVTGDFSYDADRRRTRTERLKQLAGAGFIAAKYPNVARTLGADTSIRSSFGNLEGAVVRPCIQVEASEAEVLATTPEQDPVLARQILGQGAVYFFADPIELAEDDAARAVRRKLYSSVLRAAGQEPRPIEPDEPWLHIMKQPTLRGAVHVAFNTKHGNGSELVHLPSAAGRVVLRIRNRWPALAAATGDGRLVAAVADGTAAVASEHVMSGNGMRAILALDELDLRESQALLIAPFEPGEIELPRRPVPLVAVVGEFRQGRWTVLESVSLDQKQPSIKIDKDRAVSLILVCHSPEQGRWGDYLSEAICRPDRIPGY